MNIIRKIALILMIMTGAFLAAGCWSYREIDKLAVAAGVAVDKGANNGYKLTIEIIQISGGKETKTTSKLITAEGKTIFDAVRNGIAVAGKKLYWSHAKTVIISEKVAREGVVDIIDWFNRDSETRSDIDVFISKGIPAGDILKHQGTTEEVTSYEIDDMIKSQKDLSKASKKELIELINELETEGISATVPSIELKEVDGKRKPSILGTAVFKKEKLIGFLDEEDTKKFLFVLDKIKGGIIVVEEQNDGKKTGISLEIFKNKTKIESVVNNKTIKMNINTETTVAIDEIQGTKDFIKNKGQKELENDAEKMLEKDIEALIKKVQSEFGADIFGFGRKLHEDKNKKWIKLSGNWEEEFKNLKVNIKSKIHIKNSATMSKPLKVGD